jgi:glycosyltransferase involved in cell wall biosynthesis
MIDATTPISLHRPRQPDGDSPRERVLHVVLSLRPGGTERLVIDLAQRSAPFVDSAVCCLDEPGDWADELARCGVPISVLGRRPGFSPSLGLRIARVAAAHRARVIHCHQYTPFVYGAIAALGREMTLVFTEHGRLSSGPPSNKRRLANRILGRMPSRVCAVSRDLRRHLVAEGFRSDRVKVVYNGIDPGVPPTPAVRETARALLGVRPNQFVIGTVGRLDPVKDLRTLIEAFAIVRATANSHLVIVGDGPEREALERLAAETGVASSISFFGYCSNVPMVLAAFDLYVNSSIHEGVSLTVLEAMAASLPVVATSVGGNPEVVVDGETGYLVADRTPVALAEAMLRLDSHPALRRSLGAQGRARVEREFSLDRMVSTYLAEYGVTGDVSCAESRV